MASMNIYLTKQSQDGTESTTENLTTGATTSAQTAMQTTASQTSGQNIINASVIKGVANQGVSLISSNIGNFTGDSNLQTQISNALTIGTDIALMAINPVVGVASIASSVISTGVSEYERRKLESYNLSVARSARGYTDAKSVILDLRH